MDIKKVLEKVIKITVSTIAIIFILITGILIGNTSEISYEASVVRGEIKVKEEELNTLKSEMEEKTKSETEVQDKIADIENFLEE